MTLFVSVWDIPDFYIHYGFEIKTLGKTLTQDPILKPFHPVWQEGKGWGVVLSQKKENIKYLPVSVGIHDGLSQHVLMCKLARKYTWLHFNVLGP